MATEAVGGQWAGGEAVLFFWRKFGWWTSQTFTCPSSTLSDTSTTAEQSRGYWWDRVSCSFHPRGVLTLPGMQYEVFLQPVQVNVCQCNKQASEITNSDVMMSHFVTWIWLFLKSFIVIAFIIVFCLQTICMRAKCQIWATAEKCYKIKTKHLFSFNFVTFGASGPP